MNRKVLGVIVSGIACLGWDLYQRLSVRKNRGLAKGKRLLILGGGFAGVEACRELEHLLPGDDNGEILLVNRTEYLLFTPMLTEAVGADVEPHHIIVPLHSYTRRTKVIVGDVEAIDLKTRTVTVCVPSEEKISADHLVIALGATTNFHHAPGVEKSAIPMKTLEDAWRVKQGALSLVKAAAREHDPAERAAMLTFVVAGGGYTGVETIASLNEMVRDAAAECDKSLVSQIRMLLAEPAERLMSEVTKDLADYSQQQLEKAGIEVKLKTGIKSAEGDVIELANGEKIRARTFIWTAGVEANRVVAQLDAPKGKGQALQVSGDLALTQFQGVWALGDCAEVPKPNHQGSYAPIAQNALREGTLVAQNIVRQMRGEPLKPFTYTPIGELALVGRRRGVARIYNFNISGFIAYAMWRFVYFAKLPSMSQRLRVLSDWVLDAVLGPVSKYHYIAATPDAAKLTAPDVKTASA